VAKASIRTEFRIQPSASVASEVLTVGSSAGQRIVSNQSAPVTSEVLTVGPSASQRIVPYCQCKPLLTYCYVILAKVLILSAHTGPFFREVAH
jgi:hypothetical protein